MCYNISTLRKEESVDLMPTFKPDLLKTEKWSRAHPFEEPKNIVICSSDPCGYINVKTGKRGISLMDVVPEEDYYEDNYNIQAITDFAAKAYIRVVPEIDAVCISIICGDFSDYYTRARSYTERRRFFVFKDKTVARISNIGSTHDILGTWNVKDMLISELRSVCPYYLFNNSEYHSNDMFKYFSEFFGPVAILGANHIIPFDNMSVDEFAEFLKYFEPINTNNKKIEKYINAEDLEEFYYRPTLPTKVVSVERLKSGISVARCIINEKNKEDKTTDIMRFYFDKGNVTACRLNNFGEWVPVSIKQIKCNGDWLVLPFEEETVEGGLLENIMGYFDDIEKYDRWPVLIGSICYPWFVKLMNSDFAPVLINSIRHSPYTPKKSIKDVVGYIDEHGKTPRAILKMNNYQIKYLGNYYKKNFGEYSKKLIKYVKLAFNEKYKILCELNNGLTDVIVQDVKQDINDIDRLTFTDVAGYIEEVIFRANNEKEIIRFAACVNILYSVFGPKSMRARILDVYKYRKDEIPISRMKFIAAVIEFPTKEVLSLYLYYLYVLGEIKKEMMVNHSFAFCKYSYNIRAAKLVKHLDTKLDTPDYFNLVEKYNLAISILAAITDDKIGSNIYQGQFFGCAYNLYDTQNDFKPYTKYYYGNEDREDDEEPYMVLVPRRTADVAIEAISLHNFARKYIVFTACKFTKIFFVRRKDDLGSPYYTIRISNNNELVELAGFDGYYPKGNRMLLDFVKDWCEKNKIIFNPI